MSFAEHTYHYVDNKAGWKLELKQCRPPKKVHPSRNPIAVIPGYGMNSFIFGFHPRGLSMEDYYREKDFEVWSINLRGQGGSQIHGGHRRFGLRELALDDLGAALHYIVRHSRSRTGKVDLIGCSLGGTLSFIHAALTSHNKIGAIVAMGAPLRWEAIHPLLKIVFYSPALIGLIPVPHTRMLLRLLAPFLMDSPLLKLYLHREIVDLKNKDVLLETIENPNRFVNREIAEWIRNKDLIVDRKNVTREFRKSRNPLLCVVANSDGIVPPMTALSAEETSGAKVKETLVVGTDRLRFAHADLFISNYSHDLVFKPTAEWLLKVGRA